MKEKIKVLYIDHAATYPEEQKRYQTLAQQEDLEIVLIRPSQWTDKSRTESFENREQENSFRIVHASVCFKGYQHRSFFINKIGQIVKEFQPDIIHLFEEANTIFSLQACIIKRLFCRTAKLVFDNFQNILFDHPDFRFHYFYDFIEALVFKEAVCATVRYHGSRDFLLHKKFNKPIYELPWGTDTTRFKRVESTRIKGMCGLGDFSIGYIGRLEEEKGILLLIEALSKLKRNIKLIVIGTGNSEKKMIQLMKDLRLTRNVINLGYIPHTELPKYYSAFDCIVVPTITMGRCKEQFGRVIIEAMACETPVIGSTSGAIPSVISDAGLIFQENDPDDLSAKIELLIANNQLRTRLARLGRERVLRNYTWETFSDKCLEIYKEILKSDKK